MSKPEKMPQMLSQLAHDVRNPLAIMQSFLNILELQEYKCNPEELRELSVSLQESVDSSIQKIDRIIEDIRKETGS